MTVEVVDATVTPKGYLDILSQSEIAQFLESSQGGAYSLLRNCCLAVLSSGSEIDDGKALLDRYRSFKVEVLQTERGIKLKLTAAPASAFVDGKMIRGIGEHLFAALRDIVYLSREYGDEVSLQATTEEEISQKTTDQVFHILRNANIFHYSLKPRLVVCWGGHSISREEYDYTKKVGYELGLRGLDICTGCGPGAMKGPMKGATIGHAKQRIRDGQYLGLTEPGIVAAEAPNAIVNDLVILPDIEKRLEAFVRTGHGIIVFPGGVGTAEEILYLLGILLHPQNAQTPFPLIFTGPHCSRAYFEKIDQFIHQTLGEQARQKYQIIVDDPQEVARRMKVGIREVRKFRRKTEDAYYFNWRLKIDGEFQKPFHPSHENMRNLSLRSDMEAHLLAANLRRAFSGIVAGNVKDMGIREIEKHGHYEINGDFELMKLMDDLLTSFVEQKRMKLPGTEYIPCYRVLKESG